MCNSVKVLRCVECIIPGKVVLRTSVLKCGCKGFTWSYKLEGADRWMMTDLLKVHIAAIIQCGLPCFAYRHARLLLPLMRLASDAVATLQ